MAAFGKEVEIKLTQGRAFHRPKIPDQDGRVL
jgi:hypothetical protein